MKILFPSDTEVSGDNLKVTSKAIKLSEVTQGRHVGLIPLKLKGSNSRFERLYRVEVAAEASDNGKGYRRVMLKVTIPYHRIWTADPAAAAEMREKQDSASAGSISMHVVLSIPNKVRQDLVESSDAAATCGAEGHLAVVGALLSALTDQIRKPALVQQFASGGGAIEWLAPNCYVLDDEGTGTITGDPGEANRLSSNPSEPFDMGVYNSERFGTVGLQCEGNSGTFLSQNPRDPLVRGLFGLAPIEENTSIVAGPSIVLPA